LIGRDLVDACLHLGHHGRHHLHLALHGVEGCCGLQLVLLQASTHRTRIAVSTLLGAEDCKFSVR
jgi:hypothetical protein